MASLEQLHSEVGLQALYLVADCCGSDEQLRGRGLETAASRGRFEGPEGIERRKVAGLHDCLWLAVQRTSYQVIFSNAGGKTFRLSRPAVLATIGTAKPQRSEEHTSELQSLMRTSYAVF